MEGHVYIGHEECLRELQLSLSALKAKGSPWTVTAIPCKRSRGRRHRWDRCADGSIQLRRSERGYYLTRPLSRSERKKAAALDALKR